MLRKSLLGIVAAASVMTVVAPAGAGAAGLIKINASAIGRPPIFSNTFADVGTDMGYWKAAGVDVNFRWFQRGSDTAKAVITGDVAIGFTATQPALNLIAAGAPVVVVAGQPNQDFFVASDDPSVHGCKDLKGKTVAADGINNARYLYLAALLQTCGLKLSDLTAINLANAPLVKAGIAGQVHTAVWHVDELAEVEFMTHKNWRHIKTPAALEKSLHYAVLLASKKAIAGNRQAIVSFLEGWILTQNLMSSPSAADKVAFATAAAKATGDNFEVALKAIGAYQDIGYWVNDDGLNEDQMMSQLDKLVAVGSVKPNQKPTYAKIVDKSLYAAALKRVEAEFGSVGH
jgi:ABC-type nitrate/sulfonate/bicarbonate transport system substrate-binding protein